MRTLNSAGLARLFAGILSLAALGVSPAARADVKIGYFDVKQILAEADEAAEIKKKLQGDFDKKQKELDQLKTDIETLQKQLEAKQNIVNSATLQQMQQELGTKVQAAQKRYMELQQDLQTKEQAAIGQLLGKLSPIVQQVAQDEGYTYVFEKNESGLFYGPAQHDLTSQLLRKVNQAYQSGKAPKGGKGK